MGKSDTYTKPYLSVPVRFAEFFNVTFYKGESVLESKDLSVLKGAYPSLASKSGENQRDILMEYQNKARYGLELEADVSDSEPEKVMHYDTCDYEQQIHNYDRAHRENEDYKDFREIKSYMTKGDKLLPVNTTVFYLGEGRWDGHKKLSELLLEEGKELLGEKLVDYPVDVIEVEKLQPELFHTDLREFIEALQCRKDKKRLKELLRSERYQNLSHDAQLAITANISNEELLQKVEEGMKMCQAIDEMLKDERAEGKAEGEVIGEARGVERGRNEGILHTLIDLVNKNVITKEIAAVQANMSIDEFMAYI